MSTFPLVEVRREKFDGPPWFGFVVGKNESLVVLHRISDRYDLDGYIALRRQDITSIEESFERCDFLRRVTRLKQLSPSQPLEVDFSSMRALMPSAQAEYGVLVIHREELNDDEVEVGSVRMTSEETYVLRWLSVNAEWENDDRPFRYRDVSMVEFGAEYEQTLLRVAADRENGG